MHTQVYKHSLTRSPFSLLLSCSPHPPEYFCYPFSMLLCCCSRSSRCFFCHCCFGCVKSRSFQFGCLNTSEWAIKQVQLINCYDSSTLVCSYWLLLKAHPSLYSFDLTWLVVIMLLKSPTSLYPFDLTWLVVIMLLKAQPACTHLTFQLNTLYLTKVVIPTKHLVFTKSSDSN